MDEMRDMLVRLYDLPDVGLAVAVAREHGVEIRRARSLERQTVSKWVAKNFNDSWANQVNQANANMPSTCLVAIRGGKLVGFACYDATCRNFFGPMGVDKSLRGKGIGKALLLATLHAMAGEGYAYAIIGGVVEAKEFYSKLVGAVVIEGSSPGVYGGTLRPEEQ